MKIKIDKKIMQIHLNNLLKSREPHYVVYTIHIYMYVLEHRKQITPCLGLILN